MSQPLQNRTIALPETRELDLFAQMLEQRGAVTLRCPLIAILDAPDQVPIIAWLKRLAAGQLDDLILLTGEGLKRLLSAAERAGMKEDVIAALDKVRKITRGPKPARTLRDLGLRNDISAEEPTTDGVIAALGKIDLQGRAVGVQLYGTEPNLKLIKFLQQAGATPYPVAPYIYASKADDNKVIALIRQLALGEIDVIAFTTAQQVIRLCDVAKENQLTDILMQGLKRTKIAAVGPIVAESLKKLGVRIDMMPEDSYFMKPLVNAMVAALGESK